MPAIVTTITVTGQRITWDGAAPEFRETSQLRIYGSGLGASTIAVRLKFRGATVAEFLSGWSAGDGYLVCEQSLNTTRLQAAFNGRADDAVARLTVQVHNSATGSLVASGVIPCSNNPAEGFDPPTAVDDVEYMAKGDYDADDDGVIDDDALPPGAGGSGALVKTEAFTLTGTQIANKYVTLTFAPDGRQRDVTFLGITQRYGTDYTLVPATRRLSWDGLGLDGDLEVGDLLTIEYTYTET